MILGVNPNISADEWSELLSEHSITWERHVLPLSKGKRGQGRFAFAAYRTAAALLDLLDDSPVRLREPEELVDIPARTARLQAVKCLPKCRGSTPRAKMWKHCPPLLLGDELNVLRPSALLVLGGKPLSASKALDQRAAGRALAFEPRPSRLERVTRGLLCGENWSADVYGLPHPRAGKDANEQAFIRSLRRRQTQRSAQGS